MRRIIVIGTTGSGKTTLARNIAGRLRLPHGEQDAWNHGPGWQPEPEADFRAAVDAFTSGPAWVMDGNYGKARDIGWARADTLVWLDYPGPLVLWRLLTRTARRVVGRQELWNGNRETLRGAFEADAPLRWFFRTHWRRRRETPALPAGFPHLTVIRLRSARETRRWLQNL
jgi:adenylate kinase family enzyme